MPYVCRVLSGLLVVAAFAGLAGCARVDVDSGERRSGVGIGVGF